MTEECCECGNKGILCECERTNLLERMGALDDREPIFTQRVRKAHHRRHFQRYIRYITRIKFIRGRTPSQLEALKTLVTKCERLMDAYNVPDNFFEIVPDEEEIVYLSEIESEPEAEFTDEITKIDLAEG